MNFKASVQEIREALTSVDRQPLSAFQSYVRPATSSPTLDDLETRWWNQYGRLIEKVWSLPDDLCWALRGRYLQRAKEFFLEQRSSTTILEIGCGSGWLGRFLADENLRVIGIDGSATQIEIAQARAVEAHKQAYCTYYCTSSLEGIEGLDQITGVVMHAFLHHLYWDELEGLFSSLRRVIPGPIQLFLMEPVYHEPRANPGSGAKELIQADIETLQRSLSEFEAQAQAAGRFDAATEAELNLVIQEATQTGYFLSPKEVPFFEAEIQGFFQGFARLNRQVITGLYDVDVAQRLAYIQDEQLRKEAIQTFLIPAQEIDQRLIQENLITEVAGDRYLFTCYEGELFPAKPPQITAEETQRMETILAQMNAGRAVEALQLASPANETDPASLYGQAIALARLNRLPEAIAALTQLLNHVPAHPKAQTLRRELQALQSGQPLPSALPMVQPNLSPGSVPMQPLKSPDGALLEQMPLVGFNLLNPTTLAQLATTPVLWQELLAFHPLLVTDEYVAALDEYYRACIDRFGPHWYYLDIVNVLFTASKLLQPRHYLEIGVRRGRSVCTVAHACPTVNIYAFDMWVTDYAGMENPGPEFVRAELQKHNYQGTITFIDGDSHQTLPQFFADHPDLELDLITVDGDHSEEGALADLCDVIPRLAVGGVLVFDDIAHPAHPYLLDVWRQALAKFPEMVGFEFVETGYGIGFAVRRSA